MFDQEGVETFRSIVEMIAIAITGLWVAWTFHRLQSVRASEAAIAKTLMETKKNAVESAEADQRLLSQQPNLDIEFSQIVEHAAGEAATGSFLGLTIKLHNSGSRNLVVELDTSTLSSARFVLTDTNRCDVSDVYRTGAHYIADAGEALTPFEYRILRVGQERQIIVLAPAPMPGLYLVQFKAIYYMLPFDAEEPDDTRKVFPIQAVQQRLVQVPIGGNSESVIARVQAPAAVD